MSKEVCWYETFCDALMGSGCIKFWVWFLGEGNRPSSLKMLSQRMEAWAKFG